MRSGFQDREDAIERKFQHDNEIAFKVRARRNRLFGFWVGKQLGLEAVELESYATRIVIFSVQNPSDADLIRTVYQAFQEKNVSYTEHQIQKQLSYFQDDAQKELAQPMTA